jgi:hypothetical protein
LGLFKHPFNTYANKPIVFVASLFALTTPNALHRPLQPTTGSLTRFHALPIVIPGVPVDLLDCARMDSFGSQWLTVSVAIFSSAAIFLFSGCPRACKPRAAARIA